MERFANFTFVPLKCSKTPLVDFINDAPNIDNTNTIINTVMIFLFSFKLKYLLPVNHLFDKKKVKINNNTANKIPTLPKFEISLSITPRKGRITIIFTLFVKAV